MRLRRDGMLLGLLRTDLSSLFAGRVSIGFIHATPGDMKSFRSSAERMALIVSKGSGGRVATSEMSKCDRYQKCEERDHEALKEITNINTRKV